MAGNNNPNQQRRKPMGPKKKPFRVEVPEKHLTIASFDSTACALIDKVAILGLPMDGELPEKAVVSIRYEPENKDERWERWYEAPDALDLILTIFGKKGVRWTLRDENFVLLVDGEEVNSWLTTDKVKKADEWLYPVAAQYLSSEVVATMFPNAE